MGVAPSNRQPHPLHPPRRDRQLQPPADRHRPLPLVAHIPGKPQTAKRLGDTARPAPLAPVFARVAAGFCEAVQQHP